MPDDYRHLAISLRMGLVGAYVVMGSVVAVEEPADAEDDKPYWCEGQSSRSVGFLGQQHEDEHEEHQHGPAHAATSRHGVLRCSMGCGSNPAVFHVADDDHAPDEDE